MTIQKTKILTVLCVFFVVFSSFCSVKAEDLIYSTGFEEGDNYDNDFVETTFGSISSISISSEDSPYDSLHLKCITGNSVGAKAFSRKAISPLTEVYAQVMIKWNSGHPVNQDVLGHIVFGVGNVTDSGQCNVIIYNDNNNFRWGVRRYDSGVWNTVINASSSLNIQVYYKVELRVSQTSYSLWINDVLTLTESGLNINPSYSQVFCGNTYGGGIAHRVYYDNLKISDDYIDATPPPTPTPEPTEEPTAEPTLTVTSSPTPTATVPSTLNNEQYLFLFNLFPFIIICIPALILGYYFKAMGLLVGFLLGSIVCFGIGLIPSWVFILILIGIASGFFVFKKYQT